MAEDASSPLARAKALSLRALAARARTIAQIRARLAKAGFEPGIGDEVVAWLLLLGYLDDEAFARARARALLAPGRLGPRLAERRLLAAGVAEPVARAAIAAALAGPDADGAAGDAAPGAGAGAAEVALCRALAERRARGAPSELDRRARARLARFLLGRGFSGSAVSRVVGTWEDADP